MSSSSSKTKPFSRSAGDWTCPDKSCGNLNFARRDQCNRCDTAKPSSGGSRSSGSRDRDRDPDSDEKKYNAIGNAAAKSSRGLFSPEDWSCMKCGNINWARRSTCNICNAKKFADEERTGYGGGYNERSNVEYKERPSSDSEFDEFGRRKKKKNRQSSDRKTVTTKSSRETRRSRSRSRSSRSSSSSSSSERNHRRKRSRKSPSANRDRRRRRSPSSSSSSDSSRERSSRKRSKVPDEKNAKTELPPKEKSPPRNDLEEDDDEEESGSDEDLSKYNLFDDDFDVESFKKEEGEKYSS